MPFPGGKRFLLKAKKGKANKRNKKQNKKTKIWRV